MSTRGSSHTRDDGRHWLPSQGVDPGPLTELNAECLGLLALRAADRAAHADLPPLLVALRDSWATLPADSVRRLAAAPFSLFDAGFSAAPRWLEGRVRGVHDQQRCGPAYFDDAAARSITRRMLVYGWHLARSRPRAACLVFGATLTAVEALAACSLSALDAAADRNAGLLRPRWANQPIFWRELLAAAAGNDTRLHELLLGGIQRLAAETWAVDSPDTTRASFR
jgi:hypothetical protein